MTASGRWASKLKRYPDGRSAILRGMGCCLRPPPAAGGGLKAPSGAPAAMACAAVVSSTAGGNSVCEPPVQGTKDEIVDLASLAEADLVLGGMDIDVHQHRRELQIEQVGRMTAMVQHILIGLTYRMAHQLVPNHAAVDVKELQIRLTAGEAGARHPTM